MSLGLEEAESDAIEELLKFRSCLIWTIDTKLHRNRQNMRTYKPTLIR